MSETLIPSAVPLADIAKHLKLTAEQVAAEATALQMFTGVDWRGEPAVSTADAHQLVTGQARRDHDQAAAWAAHLAATEAWEVRRQGIYSAAYNASMAASRKRGTSSGEAAQDAQESARTATARFEKATPPPQFNGTTTTALWYERPGLIERVLGGRGKSQVEDDVREMVQ